MKSLERLLHQEGVLDFDCKNNYIRCFSHIINLCSQACIKAMELNDRTSAQYSDTETDSSATDVDNDGLGLQGIFSQADSDQTGSQARKRATGPIYRARKSVAFIRHSGQRRDYLVNIIQDGNKKQFWTVELPDGQAQAVTLTPVMVIADVKTRWDSVYSMVQRLQYLQQVSSLISAWFVLIAYVAQPVQNFFLLYPDA
jgi:hypothetical protein